MSCGSLSKSFKSLIETNVLHEGIKYWKNFIFDYSRERMSETDENANSRNMKSKVIFLEEKSIIMFSNFIAVLILF